MKLRLVGVSFVVAALILLILAILTGTFWEFVSGYQAIVVVGLGVVGLVLSL